MKSIEWLKEEVYEMMPSHSELYDHPDYTTVETVKMLDRFIGLIDQVEQPALPVIPVYVAEWIEKVKEYDADILTAIIDGHYNIEVSEWLFINVEQVNVVNIEKLMRAWLDGYTVEEKKYVVKTNIGTYFILDERNRAWDYTDLPEGDDSIKYATKFVEKERAEATALLIDGTVKEVNE